MYTGSKQHSYECVIFGFHYIIKEAFDNIKLDLLLAHIERNSETIDEMIRKGVVTYDCK
jgi:hypothetical protein